MLTFRMAEMAIDLPEKVDLEQTAERVRAVLRELGFTLRPSIATRVEGTKRAPMGVNLLIVTVALSPGQARLEARTGPRWLFLGLLPLTGCGLGCGAAMAGACTCGVGGVFLGQAAAGAHAYSKHLIQLVAERIENQTGTRGRCPSCGTVFSRDTKWCRYCGRRLTG